MFQNFRKIFHDGKDSNLTWIFEENESFQESEGHFTDFSPMTMKIFYCVLKGYYQIEIFEHFRTIYGSSQKRLAIFLFLGGMMSFSKVRLWCIFEVLL